MTARRELFLEGSCICDAEGRAVCTLTPEGRMTILRVARHCAVMRRSGDPATIPGFQRMLEVSRERIARLTPEELAAATERAELFMADVRRRAAAEVARRLADVALQIPDDTTERLPLFP